MIFILIFISFYFWENVVDLICWLLISYLLYLIGFNEVFTLRVGCGMERTETGFSRHGLKLEFRLNAWQLISVAQLAVVIAGIDRLIDSLGFDDGI